MKLDPNSFHVFQNGTEDPQNLLCDGGQHATNGPHGHCALAVGLDVPDPPLMLQIMGQSAKN